MCKYFYKIPPIYFISFLILTFFYGCASSSSSQQTLNFFTCSRWMDKDQNGTISMDEWEGLGKINFRSYDDICFVGYFYKPIGTHISWSLRAPNGEVIGNYNSTQTFEVSIFRQNYIARNLIENYGTGVYRMEWFVEGVLVGESRATLIK